MITCQFEKGYQNQLRHAVSDVVAVKENKILMVKRSADTSKEPNRYGLPGGFMDRDETTAETALRELREETGYKGKIVNLLWIIDNPNRCAEEVDDRQNINFVYIVKVGKKISDPDHEVQSIHWFDLDDLPPQEQIAFDHAEIIDLYKKWQEEKFRLPIIGKDNK